MIYFSFQALSEKFEGLFSASNPPPPAPMEQFISLDGYRQKVIKGNVFYSSTNVGFRWLASDLKKYAQDPCSVPSLSYVKIDGEWYFETNVHGHKAYALIGMDPETAGFLRLLGIKRKISTVGPTCKDGRLRLLGLTTRRMFGRLSLQFPHIARPDPFGGWVGSASNNADCGANRKRRT